MRATSFIEAFGPWPSGGMWPSGRHLFPYSLVRGAILSHNNIAASAITTQPDIPQKSNWALWNRQDPSNRKNPIWLQWYVWFKNYSLSFSKPGRFFELQSGVGMFPMAMCIIWGQNAVGKLCGAGKMLQKESKHAFIAQLVQILHYFSWFVPHSRAHPVSGGQLVDYTTEPKIKIFIGPFSDKGALTCFFWKPWKTILRFWGF